ncbi:hypothetical protein [Meiothermus sp.]|nr:hypothetical protein [Meiothermus sp.]GIW33425.1 MAG: hypothetical protein KatS3mg072_0758 [Meiothermus sp.]
MQKAWGMFLVLLLAGGLAQTDHAGHGSMAIQSMSKLTIGTSYP